MKKYLAIILVFIFIAIKAKAANHFVREGATGNANGNDWVNAYTSLPADLIRGDTYYIASGSYPGRSFDTPTSGTALVTIKKAIESDHGTNTGWQSSYGSGQAIFNGMLEFTTSYWFIDGQRGGGPLNNWSQDFGFKIIETADQNALIRLAWSGTADNITVRHVEMEGKGSVSTNGGSYSNDGVAMYGVSSFTLSYYWMHGIGRCPFFGSPADSIFEYGYITSYFGSSAVHSEVASLEAYNRNIGDTTFRYNLITDIESTGGLMWNNNSNPSAHLYVYGNVFYKPLGAIWGVANGLIGGWTTSINNQASNIWVYNNTFINVDQQSLSSFPTIYSGNIASNNIFYNSNAPDFSRFPNHDYNYFINSGGTQSEPNGVSTASGNPFVNYVALDFRLNADTVAGISLPSPYNMDPLGTVRGVSGIFDRGAFQFQGNSSSTVLLAPTNLRIK
ncbi:MAG: hypothetical protein ACXVCP_02140 [Bdellovibrio sp.]